MRPDSPALYKPGLFDRESLRKKIPVSLRIIVRNLERRPWKAALSVLMISLSVAILIAGRYTYDSLDRMVQVEFLVAMWQRWFDSSNHSTFSARAALPR